MTTIDILSSIGQFSNKDAELFEHHAEYRLLQKNEVLLQEGDICKCFYFIVKGSFYQFEKGETDDVIIDLHLPQEWMFNQHSLTGQTPSTTSIKAFSTAEVMALSLNSFHCICAKSPSFLQFGKILNQAMNRAFLYDHSLTPQEKYHYINQAKPALTKLFPVKMIASYLKMAPETLSRVRANY